MSIDRSLTVDEVVDMFRSGHSRLKRNVSMINGLNVFPVPDGDTGTNMELSLASGVRAMEAKSGADLHTRFSALATGLLMGARGNSGVILSQLLRGFEKINSSGGVLDVALFSQALQEGVTIAYHAVAKPVEGTILTVAREAAAAGRREARTQTKLSDWMRSVTASAQGALDKTPEQLPVLKQAGVVDSGGQGLVCLLEGFLEYLSGDTMPHRDDHLDDVKKADVLALDAHHESGFGYCTEVLIRVNPLESERVEGSLRSRLSEYGDSLLVVSAADLVKVHVHTVEPGRVLEDGLKHGPLVKIKIENMTEQFEEAHGTQDGVAKDTPGSSTSLSANDAPLGPNPVSDTEKDGKDGSQATVEAMADGHITLVVVAAGEGIESMFESLGVTAVVSGGRTMNPSTEELVDATKQAMGSTSDKVIILPNHKNVIMAAEQAAQIIPSDVQVVPTVDIVQGLAAVLAFKPGASLDEAVKDMTEAARTAHSGSIVEAARDTEYEGFQIRQGQYLSFVKSALINTSASRIEAFSALLEEMWFDGAELLTVFYRDDSLEDEREALEAVIASYEGLEVEFQFGGQPIYDYLIALE